MNAKSILISELKTIGLLGVIFAPLVKVLIKTKREEEEELYIKKKSDSHFSAWVEQCEEYDKQNE